MIHADPFTLPLLYAGVLLAAIVSLWLFYEWRRAARRRRDRVGYSQCRLCAGWIRHDGATDLVRCSACGALNEPQQGNNI